MDAPSTSFVVQVFPVSPGTPTTTTLNRSSCSGYGIPDSYRSRSRTRKVARTPSKQREETESFDSLLESFVQGLQDVDERGVKTLLTFHNDESSKRKCIKRAVLQSPIKLEDLLSDSELEKKENLGNRKSSNEEDHGLLQLANQHYGQSLRWRGMKGLVYNVIEQQQLGVKAERQFHKKILSKCFTKMKTVLNERKKRRRLAIRRAQLREHTTRATNFHHIRVLERSFLRWRAWYLYRRECQAYACRILEKANMRIAFHLWQKFVQHKQKLMRAFQAWRQYIYNNDLKKLCVACCQQKQAVLLQECFNGWVLKTAVVAGEGLLSSKLHKVWQQSVRCRALRGWLFSTRESRAYREVIKHWLNRWRLEAMWLKQKKIADRYGEQRQLKMAIALWKAEYRQSCDLRALEVKQVHAQKLKYLTLWRLATERKQVLKKERLAYNLLQRCLLRKYLSQWNRLSEHRRGLVCVAQKMEHAMHRQLISDSFSTWRRQLHCRRMLRHHLLDSESRLISRCFSTWRKLTTSIHGSTSELNLSNSGEDTISSGSLDLTRDSSSIESSRHSVIIQSTPTGRTSGDRLGYLRDLSNRIQESLQLSTYNRKGTTSVKRTKSVIRRLFVENEPLPSSEPSSRLSDSSLQSNSTHLCSCLNPQVADEIHEFQKRFADVSLSVDRPHCDSIDSFNTREYEIEHIHQSTHPSPLNTFSPSISSHSNTQSPSHNDSVRDDPLPMRLNATCSLLTVFHSWLALTRKKLSLRQRSAYLAKLFQLRRLKRNFELWRESYAKTLNLRSLETEHQGQIGIHITKSCFNLWQEKTSRGIHQAEASDGIGCLRNALTKWKIHHQQVVEEDGNICSRVVLTRTFKIWIHKLRNKKLQQKALSQWMLVVKVSRQEKQAELLRQYWCTSRAWMKWRQEHIKEATSLVAVQHHNHFLLLQVFSAWRGWINLEQSF